MPSFPDQTERALKTRRSRRLAWESILADGVCASQCTRAKCFSQNWDWKRDLTFGRIRIRSDGTWDVACLTFDGGMEEPHATQRRRIVEAKKR